MHFAIIFDAAGELRLKTCQLHWRKVRKNAENAHKRCDNDRGLLTRFISWKMGKEIF